VVEKDKLITGEKIKPGHVAVGLASNGLHTNGFSLARKVLFEVCGYTVHTKLDELDESVGEALLKPHTCYWPALKEIFAADIPVDGIAHITGGGLYDNVPRILPEDCDVIFQCGSLPVPPIFKVITEGGNIGHEEAHRVFNMGIGMVLFVAEADVEKVIGICTDGGFTAAVCGKVTAGSKKVTVKE
jgi:phosphoribosylformylglycinamidine cyclo-ligase